MARAHLLDPLDAAMLPVRAELVLFPERAVAIELDAEVAEERRGDEVVEVRVELLVHVLERLVVAVRRLDRASELRPY